MQSKVAATTPAPRAIKGNIDTWMQLGRELYKSGEYEIATELFARAPQNFWDNNDWIKLVRSVAVKLGDNTTALLHSQRLANRNAASPASVRMVEGRAREISGWIPRIPGPAVKMEPKSPNIVVHLVKESAPRLSNGFTSRSQANFVAEMNAGLNPVVITEPGFIKVATGSNGPRTERVGNIRHYHFPLGSADPSQIPADQLLEIFAQRAFHKIVQIRPAVIHVSSGRRGFETALVGLALKEKTGLPLVYEVRSFFEANWTSDTVRERTGEVFERRMEMEQFCMERADLVLTIGESMKDNLVQRGIPTEKIGLIPNGVDTERFYPTARDAKLATRVGIGRVPTFGYVSNMDHYRESQETLIEATAILKQMGSPLHCVLVGDGPRREELEALARKLEVAERVHFLGRVEHSEIRAYYSLIDIFVVPRIAEHAAVYVTPLKPFEAMACGRPVIVSDLPALRELVNEPERGISFEPGNATQLAQLLNQLYNDPQQRDRIAQAGLDWVRSERTWSANGPRYVEQFSRLTEGVK